MGNNRINQRGRKSLAEVTIRQSEVRDLLLKGNSTSDIIDSIQAQYNCGRSTVERDITIIYGELKKYIEKEKEDIISEHVAKYDKIYENCISTCDFKNALGALKQKEVLLQLHRNEPLVSVNTLNIDFSKLTTDELTKILKETNG